MNIAGLEILGEILRVLVDIRDMLKRHIPEGETETYDVSLSSTKPSETIIPPVSPWYSIFVVNNGPGNVVVSPFYGMAVTLSSQSPNNRLKLNPGRKSMRGLTVALSDVSTTANVLVVCLR